MTQHFPYGTRSTLFDGYKTLPFHFESVGFASDCHWTFQRSFHMKGLKMLYGKVVKEFESSSGGSKWVRFVS
ncbi:hypothetical protein Pyn_02713 [Prunus yedoensis var. nudiflora]|uniref:Uncharacterized protein n=1 Tax=Prunus yedoensis var. nudiflora TaxID=2094558 RepID=A0A314UJ22_PRUYE|nr:hypothetical protein Pyn_02713 [Prunus yedoensis var. nudiflora]